MISKGTVAGDFVRTMARERAGTRSIKVIAEKINTDWQKLYRMTSGKQIFEEDVIQKLIDLLKLTQEEQIKFRTCILKQARDFNLHEAFVKGCDNFDECFVKIDTIAKQGVADEKQKEMAKGINAIIDSELYESKN